MASLAEITEREKICRLKAYFPMFVEYCMNKGFGYRREAPWGETKLGICNRLTEFFDESKHDYFNLKILREYLLENRPQKSYGVFWFSPDDAGDIQRMEFLVKLSQQLYK